MFTALESPAGDKMAFAEIEHSSAITLAQVIWKKCNRPLRIITIRNVRAGTDEEVIKAINTYLLRLGSTERLGEAVH